VTGLEAHSRQVDWKASRSSGLHGAASGLGAGVSGANERNKTSTELGARERPAVHDNPRGKLVGWLKIVGSVCNLMHQRVAMIGGANRRIVTRALSNGTPVQAGRSGTSLRCVDRTRGFLHAQDHWPPRGSIRANIYGAGFVHVGNALILAVLASEGPKVTIFRLAGVSIGKH